MRRRPSKEVFQDRLSRADWVRAALKALADSGIASVRVETLAKGLEVTKGSFYWHFTNRNDLLEAMLDAWRISATLGVAEIIKRKSADPQIRLAFTLQLSTAPRNDIPGGPMEQAIREWAKESAIAKAALSRVDNERLDILESLYIDLGFPPGVARSRAVLFLSYVIGINTLARDLEDSAPIAEKNAILPILTARP